MVNARGAVAVALLSLMGARPALADPWDDLVPYVADGAKVVARTEKRIVVRGPDGKDAVVAVEPGTGVHFYFELRRRRGRNPYRVWYVSRAFLEKPHVPKRNWPQWFRLAFLRVLRVPR